MPTVINAAFIGDSHGMIVQAAAAAQEITFQTAITSASATFANASFVADAEGQPDFQMAADRLDPERHAASKINHRINKAKAMTADFHGLFADPLPVFSNIGMAARPLVHRMAAGYKNGTVSRKMLKLAVQDYFTDFHGQYVEITKHCPQVVCFYSPTRFTPETRDIWLTYDEVVAAELKKLGVEIMDLRDTLGDDDLLLLPDYHLTPEDDGVHANHDWGMKIITAIQAHPFLQT